MCLFVSTPGADTGGFLFMSVISTDHRPIRHSHLINRDENTENTAGSREPGDPRLTREGGRHRKQGKRQRQWHDDDGRVIQVGICLRTTSYSKVSTKVAITDI